MKKVSTFRCRLRSTALGIEAGRARWQEHQEASHYRDGTKAGDATAPLMGERRSLRTAAQQQPNDSSGSCVKQKESQNQKRSSKRKDKAQSRVPVTALIAWPRFHS
jgi:hypothetical protein